MTPESLIRHVDESIQKALRHESWIDESILKLNGFGTGVMRRMFSNICHMPKTEPVYCEVGLYRGATFCAAINNNPTLIAIGFEDFSQAFTTGFSTDKDVRADLVENLARYSGDARHVEWFEQDFFDFEKTEYLDLPPIDVFYYDGCHDYKFQHDAIIRAFPFLADLFLLIVDDYNWSSVRDGTQDALTEMNELLKIEKDWTLTGGEIADDPIWHNAVYLAVCSKTP